MAGDVRYCNNCRRNIAAANYVIHSLHCERNITLCGACNEPVPRSEMAKHMDEFHTLDACGLCGDEMERFQMADHKNSCCKRPVPCKFCSLECPLDEAENHQNDCGARTEKCATCKAYVKLIDQDAHKAACQHERQVKQLSSLLHQHASLCGSETENCPLCFEPVTPEDKYRHECKVACIPCEYCDTSIPADCFFDHVSICGLQSKNCLKCNASFMLKDRDAHACQSQSKSAGRCSVCYATVPWVDLREHEAGCRLAAYSSGEEDERPKFSAIPTYQKRQSSYRKTDSRPPKEKQETSTYLAKMKQCPHCKERYPDLIAEEHFKECDNRSVNCEFCGKSILVKDKQRHEKRECLMRHSTNYNYEDSENYLAGASGYTKEYEKRVKQCPYCFKKFPEIMFVDHQTACEERPFQCSMCLKMMAMRSKDNHELKECIHADRFKKTFPGSENTNSKDVPVYKRSFEKDYLEKNYQVCPFCKNRIPEAKIDSHIQSCTSNAVEKKPCHFCGAEIRIDEENLHLQKCIANNYDSCFQTPGPGNTNSKSVPVYKRTFEKDYLEKNFQVCPYCKNKIPEAKIANHIQCCTYGKKPCHFCGAQIRIDGEKLHLQECIANIDDLGFQTAGGKKGKKKNKKGKQTESDRPKTWFETAKGFLGKKTSSPEKEYVPDTYFGRFHQAYMQDVVQLPCEFCNELFPGELLIEHQSGCRPDLVSLPNAADTTTYAGDHRASPVKDKSQAIYSDNRDPRNTGALPKRNRFHRDSAEGKPGEFLSHQSPPKEERDYFNYPSGVPDYTVEKDVSNKSNTTFRAHDETPENKTAGYRTEKKVPSKNSATQLFNFSSSSSNKNSPCQSKSPPSIFSCPNDRHSPTSQNCSGPHKAELRAVGAERAERKGIVRISRDTSFNFEDGTPDKYDVNFQVPKDSRNSNNMSRAKKNQYSTKVCSQGELNIPFADEGSDIVQDESIEFNCDARLARLLSSQDPSDITEDDAKNDETFGSSFDPGEPLTLSNEEGNLSDSMEQFYDAEDDLKSEKRKSLENGDLDAYRKYLAKDEDEMIAFNHNKRSHGLDKEKVINCKCGNTICYCGVLGNNSSGAEENEDLQGNSNDVESPKLSANRATNFSRKEFCESNIENQISAEIKKRTPEFTKWRSRNICSSDSE